MVGTGSDHQAVGIEGNPAGVSDQLKSLQINNKQQHDDHVSSHDSNGTPISLSPPEKKDDDSEQGDESATNESQETAKKKNKNKSKKKKEPLQQTDPPSIPVLELFPSGDFPEGESQECKDNNLWRTTSEEKRELERLEKPIYNVVRQAAEVHRQVRKYMGSIIKPGILMIDMCETLENTVCKLISENGLQAGIAFLQGLSRLKN